MPRLRGILGPSLLLPPHNVTLREGLFRLSHVGPSDNLTQDEKCPQNYAYLFTRYSTSSQPEKLYQSKAHLVNQKSHIWVNHIQSTSYIWANHIFFLQNQMTCAEGGHTLR